MIRINRAGTDGRSISAAALEDSLFFKIFSLLIFVGNYARSNCGAALSTASPARQCGTRSISTS
jgi:hypothetical protein